MVEYIRAERVRFKNFEACSETVKPKRVRPAIPPNVGYVRTPADEQREQAHLRLKIAT
jgi:hypothetical protein